MKYVVKTGIGTGNTIQVPFLGNDGLPYLVWQNAQGHWYYSGALPRDAVNSSYADLATGVGKNGKLQIFLVGRSDGAIHVVEQSNVSGSWSYQLPLPHPVGGLKFTGVTTGQDWAGNLQVFCLGTDGLPHVVQQDSNGYYAFTGVLPNLPPGATFVAMATGLTDAGRLQLILVSSSGHAYVTQQSGQGVWSNPTLLDNPANLKYSAAVTGKSYNGKLNVILLGQADSQPYLIEQSSSSIAGVNKGVIPHYMNMPPVAALATGLGNDGTPQVICLGKDGVPYLIYQDHTSGAWSYYGALPRPAQGMPFMAVAAGSGARGNLEVICLDPSCQPYLIWQSYTDGSWHDYGPVPYITQVVFTDVAIGTGNAGNLQVVSLGKDGRLYLNWQDYQSGAWTKFCLLPVVSTLPSFTSITMAPGNGGNLQLIAIGSDQKPYLLWQDNQTGAWSYFGSLLAQKYQYRKFKAAFACQGADGNLQVTCLDSSSQPFLIWQDRLTGGWWDYGNLPTDEQELIHFHSLTTSIGADGNLQVICLAGLPYLIWQHRGSSGWFYHGQLPVDPNNYVRFEAATAAIGGDGNLQVVFRGRDGKPYLIWQDKSGSWSYYGLLPCDSTAKFVAMAFGYSDKYQELSLYCVADDGRMFETWQDAQGNWFNAGAIGLPGPPPAFSDVATGRCPKGGALSVFIGKQDGQPYYGETNPRTGGWSYHGLLENPT